MPEYRIYPESYRNTATNLLGVLGIVGYCSVFFENYLDKSDIRASYPLSYPILSVPKTVDLMNSASSHA
jgi:hypothetical protein